MAIILFCILCDCCKDRQKVGRKRQLKMTQSPFEDDDQSEVLLNPLNKRRRPSNGYTRRRSRELKRAFRGGDSTPSSQPASNSEHTGRPKSISSTGSFSLSTSNEKTQETTENNTLVIFSPDGKAQPQTWNTETGQLVQHSV